MKVNFIDRIRGKSIQEIYLFFAEKIVKIRRQYIYRKLILSFHPPRSVIQITIDESEISNSDLLLADMCCNHIFNILGSGPKRIEQKHNISLDQIQRINSFDLSLILKEIKRINPMYKLLEWQEDFKNNYLFDILQKSELIQIEDSKGYDIKIPWELARCQHLPFLARLYRKTGEKRYKDEILCVILDFILSNPVGYGVNWKCTMDVAIRVSNWVMALDLIHENSNKEIENIISKAIYQHCIFIRYHLEDQRGYRGNHYLADIVGLLYSSTFFSSEGGIKKIQEFSIKQLISSVDEQFYDDGGNFESSLPYHRLSLELAIYGLHRIFSLSNHNVLLKKYTEIIYSDDRMIEKLARAMGMMLDAIKPNGNIYQLGDNDSGHLFRFYHFGDFLTIDQYRSKYDLTSSLSMNMIWDENELSCKEIEYVIGVLFSCKKTTSIFGSLFAESFISSGIVDKLRKYRNKGYNLFRQNDQANYVNLFHKQSKIIEVDYPIVLQDIVPFYYPTFGLVGFKNDSMYLGVSITAVGQRGRGGHSHNDKLSYEFYANGIEYQCDPGSYVYTESRDWRDMFRSVLAHNSPYFGEEQNLINENCFSLKQRTNSKLMEFTDNIIQVSCSYSNIYVVRRFELSENCLIITDYSNTKFLDKPEFIYYSNGYGKLIKKEKEI